MSRPAGSHDNLSLARFGRVLWWNAFVSEIDDWRLPRSRTCYVPPRQLPSEKPQNHHPLGEFNLGQAP
eukprot:1201272-Amphidinium_carterae.1